MMDANKQILNQITGGWNLQAVTPWAAYAKHFPQLQNSTIFPFALQAAMVGWFVFPCIPGDKRPACKWKDNATNDPSQLKSGLKPLMLITVLCAVRKAAS